MRDFVVGQELRAFADDVMTALLCCGMAREDCK